MINFTQVLTWWELLNFVEAAFYPSYYFMFSVTGNHTLMQTQQSTWLSLLLVFLAFKWKSFTDTDATVNMAFAPDHVPCIQLDKNLSRDKLAKSYSSAVDFFKFILYHSWSFLFVISPMFKLSYIQMRSWVTVSLLSWRMKCINLLVCLFIWDLLSWQSLILIGQ